MDNLQEKWFLINVQINNALDDLKLLDQERDKLLKQADATPLPDLKKKIAQSVEKYETLLKHVKTLKAEAQKLEKQIKKSTKK